MNKSKFLKQYEQETNIKFESRVNEALESICSNNKLRSSEINSNQIVIYYETIEAKKPVPKITGFKQVNNI